MLAAKHHKHTVRCKIVHFAPHKTFYAQALVRRIQPHFFCAAFQLTMNAYLARNCDKQLFQVSVGMESPGDTFCSAENIIDALHLERHISLGFQGDEAPAFVSTYCERAKRDKSFYRSASRVHTAPRTLFLSSAQTGF